MKKSTSKWRPFARFEIASVFESYPEAVRTKLMEIRELIFETAQATEGVGEINETLRWGEPSYLTTESKSGSLIRIDSKKSDEYAMYFHCQTDLIDRFKELFSDELAFSGNRAITFDRNDALPIDTLRECISMALTYHLDKKPRARSRT